jgi:DNA repair exonuclease SbcCD ATPase subunit
MPGSPDETDLRYKQELVRFALGSGGKVVIEAEDAEGRLYEISRILNERPDISHNGALLPGVSPPLKNPLFFGQKELVKRGEGSEEELVERLIGSKLDAIRRDITAQQQRVLDVLTTLDKLKGLDALEIEYQNKKRDTEFRLKLFREHGVEEQLKRQVQFNTDVANARRSVKAVQRFVLSLENFLNEQESELAALPRLESTENSDVMNAMNDLLDKVRKVPERAQSVLADARADSQALQQWLEELERRRESLKEEFAAIERELSEKLQQEGGVTVRPDDFVKLNAELQKANLALSETTKSRARRNTLQEGLLKELKRLNDLWHQEFKLIDKETKKLNESQTALQIIPQYKGNRVRMIDELKGHLRGSRLREATLENALEGRADFISLYQGLDAVCNEMGDSGEVFRRYFNDARASLLTWQVPNTYQIMYHGKNLRDHSLGQRASALILFILSQRDNDLIVIDQPEDDLDNQTIFEDVIKLIQSLKTGIQFVFATHNANFPVLGDSEQVGACAFTAGTAAVQAGSIDEPEIQNSIVSIMEGGREAFARRKEIYQLWKQ